MKGIVVYYSATGNTSKIAKAIHRGLKTELEECDIVSIRKAENVNVADYDLLVIGGPIWYYRETANLRQFIYNMPDLTGKLCVLFCTHGSSPEGFMLSIYTALRKKGVKVIGWNDWYGSVYQVLHMPKPYMTDGHPDEIDIKEAEDFGREMAVKAKRIAAGETELIPGIPAGKEPLWTLGRFEDKHFDKDGSRRQDGAQAGTQQDGQDGVQAEPEKKPKFVPRRAVRTVNKDFCRYPDCTVCVDNCPVNSIDFSADPPRFRDNCINCALCDKMCPHSAIEIDAESFMQRTQHRINMEKCTYPKCTLCIDYCPMKSIDFSVSPPVFKKNCEGDDLCWVICPNDAVEITNLETTHMPMAMESIEDHPFIKLLEEAEKKGKFRRLVPLDKVGVDNIIFRNPKAPRFVIEED